MNRKVKTVTLIISLLAMCLFINAKAEAAEKTIGSFRYTYEEFSQGGIWITGIDIIREKNIQTLRVPSQIDGKRVTKIGKSKDGRDKFGEIVDSDNIFGIYLSEDSNRLEPKNIIRKTANIKNIILPETLINMTPNCFLRLQNGKSIYIPKGVTKNVVLLSRIKWKKFEISSQNKKYKVKNSMILSQVGKKVYGFVGQGKRAVIPEGVKTIGKQVFHGTIKDIYIPKTVSKIERYAFCRGNPVKLQIDGRNKNYGVTSGCLYSKRSGRLVVGVVKAGVIKIPKGVTNVDARTVFRGKNISKIIFSKDMKTLGYGWDNSLCDGNYNGDRYFQGNTLELVFKGKVPPKLEKGVIFLFDSISHVKITVPKGKKSAYQSAFRETLGDDVYPVMEGIEVTIKES